MPQKTSSKLDKTVTYHGEEYRVVLGPPIFVEHRNGALLSTGMPTINLADPETGELRRGLTVDIPEAPLKPNQVLVGGREEGLRALTEAGVVRHTGEYYHSREYGATFAVCDFLGQPEKQRTAPEQSRRKMKLEALGREIEAETAAARSDFELLARWQADKLLGPREEVPAQSQRQAKTTMERFREAAGKGKQSAPKQKVKTREMDMDR